MTTTAVQSLLWCSFLYRRVCYTPNNIHFQYTLLCKAKPLVVGPNCCAPPRASGRAATKLSSRGLRCVQRPIPVLRCVAILQCRIQHAAYVLYVYCYLLSLFCLYHGYWLLLLLHRFISTVSHSLGLIHSCCRC